MRSVPSTFPTFEPCETAPELFWGFPAEYKGNIFIAEYGSWNRTKKAGYQVVRVVLDAKNNPVKLEPFVTGWLQGEEYWGRPADVQVIKDGSMLISDGEAGAIYRVSYGK